MLPDYITNPESPAAQAYPGVSRLVQAYAEAGAELFVDNGYDGRRGPLGTAEALEEIFDVDVACLSARLREKSIRVCLVLENGRHAISDYTCPGGELERIAYNSIKIGG